MDEGEIMNRLWVLLLVIVIAGCHEYGTVHGHAPIKEVCIKGVVYYKDGYRLAVAMRCQAENHICVLGKVDG